MFGLYKGVAPDEVAALLREAARIRDLGAAATEEELDEFRDWKIDVLNRIASEAGSAHDAKEAAEVRELARREATALRLGLPAKRGDGECR